jgi:hypothetical protein
MKKYVAKLYDITGATLSSTEAELLSYPQFSKSRNGGLGQCKVKLNYKFGEFSSQLSKVIKIYCINNANPTGKLVYTGYVSQQYEVFGAGLQYTELVCLGIQSLLMNAYYKNGAAYSVTHTNDDVETIFQDIVDHFQTAYAGSLISYSGSSLDTVGVNVTYTFAQKKWYEAIEDAYDLAGDGWYWYVNEAGVLHLHQNPTSATHLLTIGKDVEKIEVERSVENVVNDSYLNYNGGTDSAADATSKTNYGLRENYDDDQQITNAATAGEYTDKKVVDSKDPKTRTKVTLNSEFAFEDINPGDTCEVLNLPFTSSVLTDNMIIERIDYKGEKCVLHLDEYQYLHKEIKKIRTS